jgi:flagellar basal-body rod protein FlgG
MLDSLFVAASGMHAQQTQIDTIANNLANVNTSGFKKNRVNFEDLMYRNISGNSNRLLGYVDPGMKIGAGAAISTSEKIFTQGDSKKTDRSLDVAIQGSGFFEVALPDGSYAYTRTGSFRVNNEGLIVNSDAYVLNPLIQVPNDSESVTISSDGIVTVKLPNETQEMEVGRIDLANFINVSGLNPVGNNLYLPTKESGDVLYGTPGQNGIGTLAQGYLESSNVSLVEELTNLMMAQRAYEINSKVAQASDELLGLVNNMRR